MVASVPNGHLARRGAATVPQTIATRRVLLAICLATVATVMMLTRKEAEMGLAP